MSNELRRIIDGITDLRKRVAHLEANLRRFDGQSPDDITIENNQPTLYLHELDALTDEKYWRIVETGGDLAFQIVSDNLSTYANALYLGRTANTFTYLQVGSYYSTYSFLRVIPKTRQLIASAGDVTFGALAGICLVSVYSQTLTPYHNSVLLLAQHDGTNGTVAVCGQSAGAATDVSAYASGVTGLVFSAVAGTGIVLHNYFAHSLYIDWINLSIPIGA